MPIRKSSLAALLAVSSLFVAACGNDDEAAPTTTQAAPPTTQSAASTAAPAPTTADLPTVELSVAFNLSPESNTAKAVAGVVAAVSERSGGKLVLNVFPAAQLGPVQDTVEQAALGADVISSGEPSLFAQYGVPDMSILTGPFLLDDVAEWQNILASDLMADWTSELAAQGLRLLNLGWYVGERHIMGTGSYPTPDDLSGVKIRIPPLPAWTTTFELLAATPVTVDFAEVYTALSQGVVDALEAPLSTLRDSAFYEVAKNVSLTAHFRQFQGFVMSEELFQGLPVEYQQILVEEFTRGGEAVTALEFEGQDQARADLEAEGVTFHDADQDAYREATAAFYTSNPAWSSGLYERVVAAKSGS